MLITEEEFTKFLVINRRIQGNTLRTYLNRFSIILRWLSNNNLELDKESVVQFLYEKTLEGYVNSTINTYRNTLVHIDACCKYHNRTHGFTEDTKNLPKTHSEITILTEAELTKLLSTHLDYKNRNGVNCRGLDDKYLTFTNFLAFTGTRFDEAASLKVKRLDIENGKAYLVNTKNGENRNVFFEGRPLKESLKQLVFEKDSEELVFTGSTGNKILAGTFNENLRLRAKTAEIDKWERLHAHILRHTYATQLLTSGVDITIVSKLLGHKDIRTTYETYIHILDDTLQKAIRKHPLLRPFISEREIIDEFKEMLEKFNFGQDQRFKYQVNESNNSLELRLGFNPHELDMREL